MHIPGQYAQQKHPFCSLMKKYYSSQERITQGVLGSRTLTQIELSLSPTS